MMTTDFVGIELILLAASILLGVAHIVLVSYFRSRQRGHAWDTRSEDQGAEPLTGVPGRIERALRNYLQTFPFFATSILLVTIRETHTLLTVLGAHFYFWGRIAYTSVYTADVPLAPALVWTLSTVGILMEVAALFVK